MPVHHAADPGRGPAHPAQLGGSLCAGPSLRDHGGDLGRRGGLLPRRPALGGASSHPFACRAGPDHRRLSSVQGLLCPVQRLLRPAQGGPGAVQRALCPLLQRGGGALLLFGPGGPGAGCLPLGLLLGGLGLFDILPPGLGPGGPALFSFVRAGLSGPRYCLLHTLMFSLGLLHGCPSCWLREAPAPRACGAFPAGRPIPWFSGKLQIIRKELQNGYRHILHYFALPVKP